MRFFQVPQPPPHVHIEEDDQAGGEVAEDSHHQEHGVDQREGDQSLIVHMASAWRDVI